MKSPECHVFERVTLSGGNVLICGVISHTTTQVEHPELLAERIVRFAKINRSLNTALKP